MYTQFGVPTQTCPFEKIEYPSSIVRWISYLSSHEGIPTPRRTSSLQSLLSSPDDCHDNPLNLLIDFIIQNLGPQFIQRFSAPSITEQDIANSVVKSIAEHGIPRTILSDNHRSFSGNLFATLTRTLMVNHRFTPAYHSQVNGLVERFMSTLKQMIKAYMDRNTKHTSWDRHLSEFQLAYNSILHPGTNFTPFSLVHGRKPRLLDQVDLAVTNISHFITPIDKIVFSFDNSKSASRESKSQHPEWKKN